MHFQTARHYRLLYSTPQIKRNSTILVTDIGRYLNEEVLAHEMAHYWWDRLCITSHVSGTSEQFARQFDDYFMKWAAMNLVDLLEGRDERSHRALERLRLSMTETENILCIRVPGAIFVAFSKCTQFGALNMGSG